ncbi:MAG TPA: hypothetical protein VGN13_03595 [Solirubrobacteraceae bacterium]
MLLSDLTASATRLALVGLAKNTGKTEALATLLRELRACGRAVGVTSVGRDGEEHDVIDARIAKPAVLLWGGSLVATTDALLRASGLPHDLLEQTDVRTPLGRVLIARLRGAGAIEIAGPSGAAQVRSVADTMLAHGAEQILIDGAIDRRAASSPNVADGLVMSTGAVLSEDIEEVVAQTREAVELVRLSPLTAEPEHEARLRSLVAADGGAALLIGEQGDPALLPPRFALNASARELGALLDEHPDARWLILAGALPDRFLRELVTATRQRRGGGAGRGEGGGGGWGLTVVVSDATHVFLAEKSLDWYRRQGIVLAVARPIELLALTVNPVAPESHSFDSRELCARLRAAIADVPIYDVRDPDYFALAK